MGRVKQTTLKSTGREGPLLVACNPPSAVDPFQFMFLLDDAGLEQLAFRILKCLDAARRLAVKGTCKRARDIARRAATSVCVDLSSVSGVAVREDLAVTHPNITQMELIFPSPRSLQTITRRWPKFLHKLPKLRLSLSYLWEGAHLPELRDFLCSFKSLKDLSFTVGLADVRGWFPSYSFTAHLLSEAEPLTNLDQLLPSPQGRSTAAKVAALKLPEAFLTAPMFRNNLVKAVLPMRRQTGWDVPTQKRRKRNQPEGPSSAIRPNPMWDGMLAAAAAAELSKPLTLVLTGGDVSPDLHGAVEEAWRQDATQLIQSIRQLTSLTISIGDAYAGAFPAVCQAVIQHSELQDPSWHACSLPAIPEGIFAHVTSLQLSDFKSSSAEMKAIGSFTSLQQLKLQATDFDATFFHSLPHLSSLVHLRSLKLKFLDTQSPLPDDSASSSTASTTSKLTLPALVHLHATQDLMYSHIDSFPPKSQDIPCYSAMERLLSSLTAPKLTSVTGNDLPAMAFGQFAARHPLLQLPQPFNCTGTFDWRTFRQKPLQLAVLSGDELAEVAAKYPHLIPFVDVSFGDVTAEHVKAMAVSGGDQLLHITLPADEVLCNNSVLKAIAANCPNLQTLDLHLQSFSPAGLKPAVGKLHNLRMLRLRAEHAKVDDACIKKLASSCPNLQRLCLNGMDRVSEDALLSLTQLQGVNKLLTEVRVDGCWWNGLWKRGCQDEVALENLSADGWRKMEAAGWTLMLSYYEDDEPVDTNDDANEDW